ncbi:MAG: hypothetical protein Kow00105_17670 [Phycisphaeraceae bacterium]
MPRPRISGKPKRKLTRTQVRMVTLSHYTTYFLASKWPEMFPMLFVVGFPKSGTTWVCQLFAEYLGIPFAKQPLLPIGVQSVVHGHERIWPDGPNAVYVVRDGRDAMVSMYFYLLRGMPMDAETGQPGSVHPRIRRYFRSLDNLEDIKSHLPYFIEQQMLRPHGCRTNWPTHVRTSLQAGRDDVPIVKYEDLLNDGPGTLAKAVETLTGEPADMDRCVQAIDKFSFKRQAGRDPGQENRSDFLRKGQAGDWKNHFTREAAEVFDRFAGDVLIELGYEKDRSWIEQCK